MNKANGVVDYQNRVEHSRNRQQEKIQEKVSANVDQANWEHQQSMGQVQQEQELAKNKVFAILGQTSLFNYIKYDNGKVVWLKDGLAVKILNEPIVDPQGNVSMRNTYNMEYNTKRLLTSYESDTTDPQGNITHVKWNGGTYTNDSVFYADSTTHANKNLISYQQETTDSLGNVSKTDWNNAHYDGKLLIDYQEKDTDIRGNDSTKTWFGAKYDNNKQLIEFHERDVDVKGNESTRDWTGGQYIPNPAYDKAKENRGEAQTTPEYLLVGYTETNTDARGNKTTKSWEGARYDQYGQLTYYEEIDTDALGRKSTIDWTSGEYDHLGRLIGYQEVVTHIDATVTKTQWAADLYDTHNRLLTFHEVRTDALGNQTIAYRHDIVYNKVGDILSYREVDTDAHGHDTQIIWDNGQYDKYGRLIGYQETDIDSFGNHTSKVWGNVQLDNFDQLLGYHEIDTDALGNVSMKDWQNGRYDRYGQLVSYQEFDTDILGNVSERDWSQGTYDALGHLAAYTEIRIDHYGNQTTTQWQEGTKGYNEKGQLTEYVEQFTDVYGQTSTLHWYGGIYDSYGNLAEYHQDETNPDGSTSQKVWTNGKYDNYNRLASYQENWLYPSGDTASHTWNNAVYDNLSRLISYQETFGDSAGNAVTRHQFNTTYNNFNQTTSYQETVTDSQNTVTNTTWSGAQYDSDGRILAYTQVSVNSANPNVSINTVVQGRSYDRFGQTAGGVETVTTQGRTATGALVNAVTTTRITNAVLGTWNGRSNTLQAYKQTSTTQGIDPTGVQLDYTETVQVTDNTPFSFKESIRTQALGLDHTVLVTRTNINRNMSGQITGYQDETFDQATPAGSTISQRSNTYYNGRGEIIGYQEIDQDLSGFVSTKFVSGLLYNGLSQLVASKTHSTRTSQGEETLPEDWNTYTPANKITTLSQLVDSIGCGVSWSVLTSQQQTDLLAGAVVTLTNGDCLALDAANLKLAMTLTITQDTQRSPITYDVLGRTLAYTDTTNNGSNTTVTQWQAQSYNAANLVFAETIDTTFKTGWFAQSQTTHTVHTNMTYNIFGQLSGYDETMVDSASPDLMTKKNVSGITYDSLGKMAQQTEDTQVAGKTTQTLPDLSNLNGAMLAGVKLLTLTDPAATQGAEWNWDSLTQAQKDQLLKGQTVTIPTSQGSVSIALGQGQSTVLVIEMNLHTLTTRNQAQFDSKGRVAGYTEIVQTTGTDSSGAAINKTDTTVRSNMIYDAHNRLLSYQETRTSGATPALSTVVQISGMTYDASGQATGFTEKTIQDSLDAAMPFHQETTTRRTGVYYDAAGRIVGYHESTTWSDKPGFIQQTDRLNMQYDAQGHLLGYHERVTDNQGYSTDTVAENISYNGLGQEQGRKETVTTQAKDSSGNLVYKQTQVCVTSHVRYNGLGQKTNSIETITSDVTAITQTILWAKGTYNALGQLKTFTQETRNRGPDYSKNDTTTRTDTQYNGLGQITDLTETQTSTDAPDQLITEHTYNITYTLNGLQNTFVKETHQTDATGHGQLDILTTTTRNSTQYYVSGLVKGYDEQTLQTGQTAGETLKVTSRVVRSNMSYSPAKLLTSYHDETTGNETPGVTTETDWQGTYNLIGQLTGSTKDDNDGSYNVHTQRDQITYDTLNRTTGYREQVSRTSVISGLDYSLSACTVRSQISYDSQGRVLGYTEQVRSSDQSDVLTTTIRSQSQYDDFGRLISYQDDAVSLSTDTNSHVIVDANGQPVFKQEKIITRDSTSYNALSRETGYTEDTNDLNRETMETVTRSNVLHDAIGRILTYHEKVEDKDTQGNALDVVTQTYRTSTTYDAQGRMTDYQQSQNSSASSDMTEYVIWHANTFDGLQRAVAYTQTTHQLSADGKSLDETTTLNRVATIYDGLGRVTGYDQNETYADAPGLTNRTLRTGTQFNTLGQITQYKETYSQSDNQNKLAVSTTTTRTGILYNQQGWQTAYHDVITGSEAPDVTTTVDWFGATYNRLGQLDKYNQQAVKVGAGTTPLQVTSLTQRLSTTYDNQGRIAGQQESVVSSDASDVTTLTTLSNVSYDTDGRRYSYQQITDRSTKDNNLHQTSTTNRKFTTYNAASLEAGYVETTFSSDSPDLTTTVTRFTTDYVLRQVSGYTENVNRKGGDLDTNVKTIRTNQQYDLAGDLETYTEAVTSDADGYSSHTWQADAYNRYGQLIGYTDKGNAPSSGEYTRTWTGTYDDQGRSLTFQEKYSTQNGGLDYDKLRQGTVYNHQGQVIYYLETGTSANTPAPGYTTNYWANGFNPQGQVTSFEESTVNDLGVTTDQVRNTTTYNTLGQILSYQENIHETAAGLENKQTNHTWHANSYNSNGQMQAYTETNTSQFFNAAGNLLLGQQTATTDWSNAVYTNGLLTQFTDATTKQGVATGAGAFVYADPSQFTRKNMVYDLGRLQTYHEEGSGPTTGSYSKDWTASGFDAQGRATGYTDIGYSEASGPDKYTRSSILYETHGWVISFSESGISGGKYLDHTWSAGLGLGTPAYDALGRSLAWSDSGWTEDGRYTKQQHDIAYNCFSQILGSTEDGWDLSDGSYTKTVSNTQYDAAGRRLSCHQVLVQKDQGQTVTTDWNASSTANPQMAQITQMQTGYNTKGQLLGYVESGTVTDSTSGNLIDTIETDWQASFTDSYTALGQLDHFITTSVKDSNQGLGKRTNIQEQGHSQYLVDGRISGYAQKTTSIIDDKQNTADSVHTTITSLVHSDIQYYAATAQLSATDNTWSHTGMVTGYSELIVSGDSSEKPVQHIVADTTYDQLDGKQLGYTEVDAEEDAVNAAVRRFADWLQGWSSTQANPSPNWITTTLGLSALLVMNPADVANGITSLADRVVAWFQTNVADVTSADLAAISGLLQNLSQVWFTNQLTIDGLYGQLGLSLAGLQGFVTNLVAAIGNNVADEIKGQDKTVMPQWDVAQTAFAYLHPFDLTGNITQRRGTVYDAFNRPISWTEETRSTASIDKTTISNVAVTYLDNRTQRYDTYGARSWEVPVISVQDPTAGKVTNLFRCNYTYNGADQATAYNETTFEGDELHFEGRGTVPVPQNLPVQVNGQSTVWKNLTASQRVQIVQALLADQIDVRELVTINSFQNVGYTGQLMGGYDLTTHQYGYTYQAFSEAQTMLDSLENQNSLLISQTQARDDQNTLMLQAQTNWSNAYDAVNLYFSNNGEPLLQSQVSDRDAVLAEISLRLKDKNINEANKENDMDAARQALDTAYSVLNEANSNLNMQITSLAQAENDWRNAVASENALVQSLQSSDFCPNGTTFLQQVLNSLKQDIASSTLAGCAFETDPAYADFRTALQTIRDLLNPASSSAWQGSQVAAVRTLPDPVTGTIRPDVSGVTEGQLDGTDAGFNLTNEALVKNVDTQAYNLQAALGKIYAGLNKIQGIINTGKTTLSQNEQNADNTYEGTQATPRSALGNFNDVKNNPTTGETALSGLVTSTKATSDADSTALSGLYVTYQAALDSIVGPKNALAADDNVLNSYVNQTWTIKTSSNYNWGIWVSDNFTTYKLRYDPDSNDGVLGVNVGKYWIENLGTGSSVSNQSNNESWNGTINYALQQRDDHAVTIPTPFGPINFWVPGGGHKDTYLSVYQTVSATITAYQNQFNKYWGYKDAAGNHVNGSLDNYYIALANYNALLTTLYGPTRTSHGFDSTAAQGLEGQVYTAKQAYLKAKVKNDAAQAALDCLGVVGGTGLISKIYTKENQAGSNYSSNNQGLSPYGNDLLTSASGPAITEKDVYLADKITRNNAVTAINDPQTGKLPLYQTACGAYDSASQAQQALQGQTDTLQNVKTTMDQAVLDKAQEQTTLDQITSGLFGAQGLCGKFTDQIAANSLLLNGTAFALTAAQITALKAAQTIDGLKAILLQLENAQVKISYRQVTTTSRRDMTYNHYGLLSAYNELHFTGTEVETSVGKVDWINGVLASDKKLILQKAQSAPVVKLDGGTLQIRQVTGQTYNRKGELVSNDEAIYETTYVTDPTQQPAEHDYTVHTDSMAYDHQGNLAEYRKTTTDPSQGVVTVEKTLTPSRFDDKGELLESLLETTDTYGSGSTAVVKDRSVHTWVDAGDYNQLKQMKRYLRETIEGDKITYEKSLADMKYNDQGQMLFSDDLIVETQQTADLLGNKLPDVALSEIQAASDLNSLKTSVGDRGKVTQVIVQNAGYDAIGQMTSMYRVTLDGVRRTDEDITSMTYEKGQVKTTVSNVIESGVSTLYYRNYQVTQDNLAYVAGQAVESIKTTRDGDKITQEHLGFDPSKVTHYNSLGQMDYSFTEIRELYGIGSMTEAQIQANLNSDQAKIVTVESQVSEFDGAGRVKREKKTTTELSSTGSYKQVEENNESGVAGAVANTYDGAGNLASRTVQVTESVNSSSPSPDVTPYTRIYQVAESDMLYDSLGQLLSSHKITTETGDGVSTVTDEKITYAYNIKGQMKESAVVSTKEGKTTTTVTVVPPSGYNSSDQMKTFDTLTFDGATIGLWENSGAGNPPVLHQYAWNQLDASKKQDLLSGALKDSLDQFVVKSSMRDVNYDPMGRMYQWININRVFGPMVTEGNCNPNRQLKSKLTTPPWAKTPVCRAKPETASLLICPR
jgi:hypothetical protein